MYNYENNKKYSLFKEKATIFFLPFLIKNFPLRIMNYIKYASLSGTKLTQTQKDFRENSYAETCMTVKANLH